MTCALVLTMLAVGQPPPALPAGWHGRWAGTYEVVPLAGDRKTLTMELQLVPLPGGERYTWRQTFDDAGRRTVRDYELVPKAGKPGRFEIDERNGIRLDATLSGDALFSLFQVGEAMIQSRYELAGDVIRVEVTAYSTKDPLATRPTDGGVEVRSPRMTSVHRAELKRVP